MTSTAQARDGVAIAYDFRGDLGDGPFAVVFVHGWAGNRTYWQGQVEAMSDRYPVLALDLGGHGESGRGRLDWNLPAFGDDVVAVVDRIGAQQVALVGHSMGGDAIVYAAQQLGERVVGLVWVDAFRSLGDEPVSGPEAVDEFLAPFRADFAAAVGQFARSLFPTTGDLATVERIAADMVAFPSEIGLGSLQYALNRQPPLLAAMAEIDAPITAINPDIGPTDIDSLRRHGVEPVVVDGVGHYVMLDAPERFNAILADMLVAFEP